MRSSRGHEVLLNNKQEFSRSVLPEMIVTLRDKIKSREILDHIDRAADKLNLEVEDEEMVKNRKRFRVENDIRIPVGVRTEIMEEIKMEEPRPKKPRKSRKGEVQQNKITKYFVQKQQNGDWVLDQDKLTDLHVDLLAEDAENIELVEIETEIKENSILFDEPETSIKFSSEDGRQKVRTMDLEGKTEKETVCMSRDV